MRLQHAAIAAARWRPGRGGRPAKLPGPPAGPGRALRHADPDAPLHRFLRRRGQGLGFQRAWLADRGPGAGADRVCAADNGARAVMGWAADPRPREPDGPALVLDLDGYEGPIDLLLALARDQKVDLARISILALADQYLAFIAAQRRLRLEIAADYLVMAAWLAYLKSRLLLPEPPAEEDGPSGVELAAALSHRLQVLAAMQQAGGELMARPQLRREGFPRGPPEGLPGTHPADLRAFAFRIPGR